MRLLCALGIKAVATTFLPMMEKPARPKERQAFMLVIVVGKQTVQEPFSMAMYAPF
jgi:hypothetical protein